MKKLIALLLIVVAFSSCENDVKFNDPGFQGRKDNFKWQSDLTTASVDNTTNTVTITAFKGLEVVRLVFPKPTSPVSASNPNTYTLGTNDSQIATYSYTEDSFEINYSTGIDMGNGQIVVNQFGNETVSGTFKFNATYLGEGELVPVNVNFQEGVFYKIPLQ